MRRFYWRSSMAHLPTRAPKSRLLLLHVVEQDPRAFVVAGGSEIRDVMNDSRLKRQRLVSITSQQSRSST